MLRTEEFVGLLDQLPAREIKALADQHMSAHGSRGVRRAEAGRAAPDDENFDLFNQW